MWSWFCGYFEADTREAPPVKYITAQELIEKGIRGNSPKTTPPPTTAAAPVKREEPSPPAPSPKKAPEAPLAKQGARGAGQVVHNKHAAPITSALANMCPICSCKITHTKGPHWDMHVSGTKHQKALRQAGLAHSPQKRNDDHHLQEIQRLTQENRQLPQSVFQLSSFQQ